MAVYNAQTKIITGTIAESTEADAGSLAKKVNDFVNTLDSTNNAIISISMVSLRGYEVAVMIVYN